MGRRRKQPEEPEKPKRPRGRPRKNPKPDEPAPQPESKPERQYGQCLPGDMTISALANGTGLSISTIERYLRRGCPKTSVEAVMKWRSENISAIAEDAEPSELMQELKRAEIAETNESARAKRLKNDILERKLIPRDEVSRDLSIALARTVNRLQSIPTEVAVLCPDDLKVPVKAKVEQAIRVALKELKDSMEDMV